MTVRQFEQLGGRSFLESRASHSCWSFGRCSRLLAYLQVLNPESVVIRMRLVEVTSLTVQCLSSVVSALPRVMVAIELLIFTLSPGLRFLGLLTLASAFGSVGMTIAVVVLVF